MTSSILLSLFDCSDFPVRQHVQKTEFDASMIRQFCLFTPHFQTRLLVIVSYLSSWFPQQSTRTAIPETTIARFIGEEIPIGGNEEQCVEFQFELLEIPATVHLEIDKRIRSQ
jgi:hypothetical protein